MSNDEWSKKDMDCIWHPCTQHKDHERLPPIPIARAQGIYLYDFEGKAYIDCISSWWVNLFGHSHPYLVKKLMEQSQKLDHVLLAGFSHEGIIQYSHRLLEVAGNHFDKCFYADNGSSAIEVALKMSFHHHLLHHRLERKKFLALSNSYHGETIGALSVGDVGIYKDTYQPLLLDVLITPTPKNQDDIQNALDALDHILRQEGEKICAFILEPLVQCAGNMHMYPKEYIQKASQKCKAYGIDLIFDEIAVGFGRTGSLFAFEQCGVIPDFLCLSKGITGGMLPLSVVLTHNHIFDAFYGDYETQKAFLHSHSYTGNALAIACANATLDLFEQEKILESNAIKQTQIWNAFSEIQGNLKVKNLRQTGMILAFDLDAPPSQRAGYEFYLRALRQGLLLRPLGNTIYFMPPYIISPDEIIYVAQEVKQILMNF
ncbi:adenosylmethionine--8-amino-7-oxononanoate transaminase [Helicobacter kayseriensis]|uniref:adenosylmethionine--8-amino-7-oxononanoate transaminase n=1 Tax=Helicobacter kayseriensis TaxID=2905877 RepID=UPI001E633711|nr:adenosylmethionine--8-amino-7-oxononanoate transaminase [Helicobacter kayseriensis]MCE3047761.1 adenosylmethionine--8-amino-7-oxononanoate transaminase [Helicobacter kayseriensis]MCE3049140.1 adenosylmethionine--8-amino-7-oxononanoate transaminase [Helicobacter kayseriensis]